MPRIAESNDLILEEIQLEYLKESLKLKEDIMKWRRDLHQMPETGLYLPRTAEYVKRHLDEMGIEYITFKGHSGIVALIGKRDEGKTIALRADMDALEIKEEVDLPFKSQNDKMHACGHDAHTAVLLGVAKLLKDSESKLNGCVKLIFQPAEEGPGGAQPMIKDGVLEKPDVDAIMAMHVFNFDKSVKVGSVAVGYNTIFASDDQLSLKIKGKGGHGASPHECVDPIVVAAHVIIALQSIVSREVKPSDPAVVTIASMTAGRGTTNVIPDLVEILGTIRTLDLKTRDFVLKRIEEIVAGVTSGFRADYEIEFFNSYPPLINSKEMVDKFIESAGKVVSEDYIKIMEESQMGGEDASFFFEKVPGTYFFLNTTNEQNGEVYPLHNSKFQLDDSVLYKGAAVFVQAAVDYLNE
jgi:amidohydrolase